MEVSVDKGRSSTLRSVWRVKKDLRHQYLVTCMDDKWWVDRVTVGRSPDRVINQTLADKLIGQVQAFIASP